MEKEQARRSRTILACSSCLRVFAPVAVLIMVDELKARKPMKVDLERMKALPEESSA